MNIKNLKAINKVFQKLNNLRRWTGFITEGKYDEISKQSLNCCICFMLAIEAEMRGETINWERFPKIAIYRAFQKAYVNSDVPEHIFKEICDLGNIPFEKTFKEVTFKIIAEKTDEEFAGWLNEGCGTIEERIYKAATKIATFLELKEVQKNMNGQYAIKYDQIVKSMAKYEDIPGFTDLSNTESGYFRIFEDISKLRNQNRWATYAYLVECSVLGHLFDTGIFAYLMAVEIGETEEIATKCFFKGIFHDVPEAFTKDMPSPIKDKIPGFRALTEEYENKMMEKSFYPFVSSEVEKALKELVSDSAENNKLKALIKGADYISAVSEIWRQLVAGSRDEEFVSSIDVHTEKFNKGIAEFTPVSKELYDWMEDYARKLNL